MRYWTQIAPLPAAELAGHVRGLEDAGVEGVWAPQTFGAPFGMLCAAAMATQKLQLGCGIALGFTRGPLETACNAMDLDLISGGRCILGLGSSAQDQIEKRYGGVFGKPLAHMRELVSLVREIIAKAHLGELGKFEGEYYQLDFTGFRTLQAPIRTRIPIHLPAIFEKACEQAGEIADGLVGHPLWTEAWIAGKIAPGLARGLAKSGRTQAEFEVNLSPFVMINPDRKAAIDDARATIAFYTQSPHYNPYFDYIGFGDAARAIQAAAARNDFPGMVAACPDALVETIVILGPPDEVVEKLGHRLPIATTCTPKVAHVGLSPERLAEYTCRIAKQFYPNTQH
jgi:probable F420-dependent oxidoreductase